MRRNHRAAQRQVEKDFTFLQVSAVERNFARDVFVNLIISGDCEEHNQAFSQ